MYSRGYKTVERLEENLEMVQRRVVLLFDDVNSNCLFVPPEPDEDELVRTEDAQSYPSQPCR